MSEWVQTHLACTSCGSSDARSVNDAGWSTCFSCGERKKEGAAVETTEQSKSKPKDLVQGEYRDLIKRKISEETCRKFGYKIGEFRGKDCHIADYKDGSGRTVAQKVRLPGKDFLTTGEFKSVTLYGQWLWKGGKRLVLVEGEIDCLSYAEATGCRWPVVSVPNGAQGALAAVKKNLEFVESFDDVVIMFDNDEPGQKAAAEVAEVLTPGKARIAKLPRKDANEMLLAGEVKELIDAVYNAPVNRPDGILMGSDIDLADLRDKPVAGFRIPFPQLNAKLHGSRKAELTLWTAGSGIGKSTIVRQLGHWFPCEYGHKIGNVYLEEKYTKTAQGYIAIDNKVPLGLLRENPKAITDEQWQRSKDKVLSRMAFYNHFGSLTCDVLMSKLRYMAVSVGVDWIILDHISMVVSGMESDQGERKDIDILMTKLRSLIEETGVGVHAIVHLKRPDNKRKSFNEGGQITLQDLRGSAALEQLSDNIIALERDQQSDSESDLSYIRVLKNREWGELGPAGCNRYDRKTGLLIPHEDDSPPTPEEDFTDDDAPFDI